MDLERTDLGPLFLNKMDLERTDLRPLFLNKMDLERTEVSVCLKSLDPVGVLAPSLEVVASAVSRLQFGSS